MNARSIKKAIHILEEEGGAKAAKKLILVAPIKRGASGYERDEVIRLVAKNNVESVAATKKMLGKFELGAIYRAENIANDYYVFDADLCLILDGGRGLELTGEIIQVRPENLRRSDEQIVDDGVELHDDLDAAVHGILYGSRNPYYEAYSASRSRYNPRRRR